MEHNNIPADAQERIEKDGKAYMHSEIKGMVGDDEISTDSLSRAYIKGATAEAERAQKQIIKLLNTLETIEHAPVPANEREYISWFVTAKNIAGGAISEYEADNEMQQWKDRKEDSSKRKCPDCGLWFKSEGRCP